MAWPAKTCAFYWPDEPGVNAGPTYSYIPSTGPERGAGDVPLLGLRYHRDALGELVGYAQHDARNIYRRTFPFLSDTDKAARDAFMIATRGQPIRYIDDTLPDYVTVKAVGRSLSEEAQERGGGWWSRVEELEETTDMPTLEDLAGDVRTQVLTFTGTETSKTATWSTPFLDTDYEVDPKPYLGSDGNLYTSVADYSSITANGIAIRCVPHPGTGVTVRVFVIAVHN